VSSERLPGAMPSDSGMSLRSNPSEHATWDSWASALALSVVASAGVAAVALPRVRTADGSGATTLVVLWGSAALLSGPLAAGVRLARPLTSATRAVLCIALAIGPLALIGQILKASTHHRPLGAVTFAIVALIAVLGTLAVGGRLANVALMSEEAQARTWARAVLGIFAAAAGLTALRLVARLFAASSSSQYGAVDAALLALSVAVGAWLPVPAGARRMLRVAGPAGWIAIVIFAMVLGRGAELAESLALRTPLLSIAAGL
jgi:hypothetical protein